MLVTSGCWDGRRWGGGVERVECLAGDETWVGVPEEEVRGGAEGEWGLLRLRGVGGVVREDGWVCGEMC